MAKYYHRFANRVEHRQAKNSNSYLEPWLAHTEGTGVDYNKNYMKEPFTIEAFGSGTLSWNLNDEYITSVKYSKNGGSWQTMTSSTSISVINGDEVRFIGNEVSYYYEGYGSTISCTTSFNVRGNIMSLTNGLKFKRVRTLKNVSSRVFSELFYGCTTLVSTKNLKLPATDLSGSIGCYEDMFCGCTSLIDAPALPATTLEENCYNGMFRGCTSLTTAPALPATTLKHSCYSYMFRECSSLTTPPVLPATSLNVGCYRSMFQSCTSLTTAPALPATILISNCYRSMFNGCTGLTTPPALPATALMSECYAEMFSECTSLTVAPVLPATILVSYCYENMFWGCTSLTTAPVLPAKQLVNGCYSYMFYGCTNLNRIECYAASLLWYESSDPTEGWTGNVSSTGTFIGYTDTNWERGINGIPTNWNIQSIEESEYNKYLTFDILSGGTFGFHKTANNQGTITYRLNGSSWLELSTVYGTDSTINVNVGDKLEFKGSNERYYGYFCGTSTFNVSGNIMSLIAGDGFRNCKEFTVNSNIFCQLFKNSNVIGASNLILPAEGLKRYCYSEMFYGCESLMSMPVLPALDLQQYCYDKMFYGCTSLTMATSILPARQMMNYCYQYMFYGCDSLISAPELPATALYGYCYKDMFSGCTSLTTAPSLPATTLENGCYCEMFQYCSSLTSAPELPAITMKLRCYEGMFRGCTNLTTAPSLPATTLSNNCYQDMFRGCESLTTAPELPATSLYDYCYQNMFRGCESLTTAPELPATTLKNYCYSGMFGGCESLTTAPKLPATTLAANCYEEMFSGCTSLVDAPELPATTLAEYCYNSMFSDCAGLTDISTLTLPAMKLETNCYSYMFDGCRYLQTTPELPATELAGYCYAGMFMGCHNLTTAPSQLPAMDLRPSCYANMFRECLALETAPVLPSKRLVSSCYIYMFYDCSSLRNITSYALVGINDNDSTTQWVNSVHSTGTFTGYSNANWPTGNNGIPTNWTRSLTHSGHPESAGTYGMYVDKFLKIKYDEIGNFIKNPDGMDSNAYRYINDTFTYENHTYYLWERMDDTEPNLQYALTETIDYNTLYNKSLKCNLNNVIECPIVFYLDEDFETYREGGIDCIIRVDQQPNIGLWVDDFPIESWQGLRYDTFNDYMDDYLDDLEGFGSNYYRYAGEIEYEGDTCYLWYCDDCGFYLVTETNNVNTLIANSIEYNYSNTDTNMFIGCLYEDLSEYPEHNFSAEQIVKVVGGGGSELVMYVDDFLSVNPWEYMDNEEYEYSNYYEYCDTFEYNGENYYLWINTNNSNEVGRRIKYILTTNNIQELQSKSVANNISNILKFPIVAYLDFDLNETYTNVERDDNIVMVFSL